MRVRYVSSNASTKLNLLALNRSENAVSGDTRGSVEGPWAERVAGVERRGMVRREQSVKWYVIAFYGYVIRWSI
jgi:hypothetical protein